jgi:hypothetical protein
MIWCSISPACRPRTSPSTSIHKTPARARTQSSSHAPKATCWHTLRVPNKHWPDYSGCQRTVSTEVLSSNSAHLTTNSTEESAVARHLHITVSQRVGGPCGYAFSSYASAQAFTATVITALADYITTQRASVQRKLSESDHLSACIVNIEVRPWGILPCCEVNNRGAAPASDASTPYGPLPHQTVQALLYICTGGRHRPCPASNAFLLCST